MNDPGRKEAGDGAAITLQQYLAASFAQCLHFGRWAGEQSQHNRAWLMWEHEIVSDDDWAERAAAQFLAKAEIRAALAAPERIGLVKNPQTMIEQEKNPQSDGGKG